MGGDVDLMGGSGLELLRREVLAREVGEVGASGSVTKLLAPTSPPPPASSLVGEATGVVAVSASTGITANKADIVSIGADGAVGSGAGGVVASTSAGAGAGFAGGASVAAIEVHTSGGGRLASTLVTLPAGW